MSSIARWLLAGALTLWFVAFIPTSDEAIYLLAALWLAYLLAGLLRPTHR